MSTIFLRKHTEEPSEHKQEELEHTKQSVFPPFSGMGGSRITLILFETYWSGKP